MKNIILNSLSVFIPYSLLDISQNSDNYIIRKIGTVLANRKYRRQGRKLSKGACVIQEIKWPPTMVNMNFMFSVLSKIAFSEMRGYEPVVEVAKADNPSINMWNTIFEPISSMKEKRFKTELSDVFGWPLDDRSNSGIRFWGGVWQKYVHLNNTAKEYIDEEIHTCINRKAVLGVLCRGTDYAYLKPKGHGVQPDIADVIFLCKEKMDEGFCEAIYLATEEKAIYDRFCDAFPGKIIINKRQWYDEYYHNEKINLIGDVHFQRKNDDYWKSLEYISSLYILANCKGFIGGDCGGSRAAIIINNRRFEYMHFFDLGKY